MSRDNEMTPTQRWLRRGTNLVWGLALVLVLLLALYVGLGRQVMANLHHFTDDLESILSVRLGQPVTVERLQGDWRGLDPVAKISGLTVRNQDDEVVARLGQLRVELDSWMSLRRQQVVFSDFSLTGGHLTVLQEESGRIGLKDLWMPPEAEEYAIGEVAREATRDLDSLLADWIEQAGELLHEPRVAVEDIRLRLEIEGDETTEFLIPRADLAFEGGLFQAGGQLTREQDGDPVALFAIRGQHFFSGGFDGQLFLRLSSERLFDSLIRRYHWEDVGIDSMAVDARAWMNFTDGQLVSSAAELDAPHVALTTAAGSLSPLEDVRLSAGWHRTAAGWQASVTDFQYRWEGDQQAPMDVLIHQQDGALHIQGDRVELAPLSRFAVATELLPDLAHRSLEPRRPVGQMRRLDLRIPDEGEWRLRTELQDLTLAADGGAPSLTNANAYLTVGPEDGRVSFADGPMRLGFPNLFLDDWALDRLSGQVNWHRRGDQWRVGAGDLVLQHASGARFDGGFLLRLDPDDEDILSLRIGVTDAGTDLLAQFVPAHVVPDGLYNFLTRQVGEGRIPQGRFYAHGSLDPEAGDNAFSVSMNYAFEQASLSYHEDWPEITDGAGEVRIHNDRGRVRVDRARTAGLDLDPAQVRISPGSEGPVIEIDGGASFSGDLLAPDWRQLNLPSDVTDRLQEELTAEAEVEARLSIVIRPGQETPLDLALTVDVDDGQVTHLGTGVQWESLHGQVVFRSSDGFEGSQLQGEFLGESVDLALSGQQLQELALSQSGMLTMGQLRELLGVRPPALVGALTYEATLDFQPQLRFSLDSDLTLLGVDWPEPFNKGIGVSQDLTVTASLEDEGWLLRGAWDDRVAGRAMLDADGALNRARIELGTSDTALPDHSGLELVGTVPVLDVDQWLAFFARHRQSEEEAEVEGPVANGGWPAWLSRMRLSVLALSALDRDLGAVTLAASRESERDEWTLALGGDALNGDVHYRAGEPLALDFSRIDWPQPREDLTDVSGDIVLAGPAFPEELESGGLAALTPAQRARLPAMRVAIDSLSVSGMEMGQWRFDLRSNDGDLSLSPLAITLGDLLFEGELVWSASGAAPRTFLKGTLSGGDVGEMDRLLVAGVPLRSTEATVSLDMSWRGAPDEFTLGSLQGMTSFRLRNGRITQDSDAARIFRVFGLLNTDTIWRRLRLDFSDIYEAGIPFDQLEGRAVIVGGDLILDPAIVIESPSGGFRMSGQTNLLDETLDMRLIVVLPVTQNLPLAAVLVGWAAPVAGVLWVVDRFLGGELSQITSATYNLGGTWQDPDVSLRNVFDTRSDLDSYERPELDLDTD